jgi:hypothetical protein
MGMNSAMCVYVQVCTTEKHTVITDRDSKEVTHTSIDVQVGEGTMDEEVQARRAQYTVC